MSTLIAAGSAFLIIAWLFFLACRAYLARGRAEVLAEITEEERRKADDYATIMADRRTADDVADRMQDGKF